MRKLLLSLTALIVIFVLISGTLIFLYELLPFRPGSILYPTQLAAEELVYFLTFNKSSRADLAIDLGFRRLEELRSADQESQIETAAGKLNEAVDRAVLSVNKADIQERARLVQRLNDLLVEVDFTLVELNGTYPFLNDLAQKIAALLGARSPDQLAAIADPGGISTTQLAGESVPFIGDDFDHSFFLLTNTHASIDCSACHSRGVYVGTVTECIGCHLPPIDHYDGTCISCHTTTQWQEVEFDHTDREDCQACHIDDSPSAHYEGQCSNCHNTGTWPDAVFDHAGFSDCQDCHEEERPEFHFDGQCSICHAPVNWELITFEHDGLNDCVSCHSAKAPLDHYQGQCSACHSTESWEEAVFNHEGFGECQSCHQSDRPATHYPGQCSLCHTVTDWRQVTFDHSGFNDCLSCHSAPSDHFPGQCSSCHGTSSWEDANFSHAGFDDCQSCHSRPGGHFPGQCSSCHDSTGWRWTFPGTMLELSRGKQLE
jgi:hypothetical protein